MSVSLSTLAAPLLDAHPRTQSLDLALGDCAIRVETNNVVLRDRLADYFRYWRRSSANGVSRLSVIAIEMPPPDLPVRLLDWPRDPGKVGRKDAYADIEGGRVVRKVRTGMQYLIGGGLRLCFGPCLRNENQVVNFVVSQFIGQFMSRGFALCHAAGVTTGRRGLAIAGIAGAGKSTLALKLMESGINFVSNDRLLVNTSEIGVRIAGVPKQPRINPGTALSLRSLHGVLPEPRRQALSQLPQPELWELEEKYDVDIGRTYGEDRWKIASPLDGFLILNWQRTAAEPTRFARVQLNEREDLLQAVMKPPGPFYEPPEDVPHGIYRMPAREYLDRLASVPIYEATGKVDFAEAVAFCRSVIESTDTD